MAYELSPADVEKFCKKLADFSAGLSDAERSLLKSVLDRDALSEKALGQVSGGVMTIPGGPATLNSSYFLQNVFRFRDW